MMAVRRAWSPPALQEDPAMEAVVGVALVVLSVLIIIAVVRVVGRDLSA